MTPPVGWKDVLGSGLTILGGFALCTAPLSLAAFAGIPEGQPIFYGEVVGLTLASTSVSKRTRWFTRACVWLCMVYAAATIPLWTNWFKIGSITCVIVFEAWFFYELHKARRAAAK